MNTETTQDAGLETRYRRALTAYVQRELEDALMDALDLGRTALAEGHGLLDLLAIHHTLLALLIEQSSSKVDVQRRLVRAKEFLTQVSAPFEMAHRGWHEMADRLRAVNEDLEKRVDERTKAHREAVERLHEAQQTVAAARAELDYLTNLMARGEMAAAIAHEINQPLAAIVIQGNAAMRWLAREPVELDETRNAVQCIIRDGYRAGEVIGSIRSMFRHDDKKRVPLDANEIIREVVTLAHAEFKSHRVAAQIDLANELPQVLGDRIQLQQVFFNLVMNAIDAMRSVTDRPRVLRLISSVHESNGVLMAVEDSGTGIDSKIIDRIFDPFYTTKSQGMGMGLSICRSIIEAHNGRLWATSRVDNGSVFRVVLPKAHPQLQG